MTLREHVIALKGRKGPADKITKDGAYWNVIKIDTDWDGGDGIGQALPSIKYGLQVRHYRSGDVRAYLYKHTWHQNTGSNTERVRCDEILDCVTTEEVICIITSKTIDQEAQSYGESGLFPVCDKGRRDLEEKLGLPVSLPSPDEIEAVTI